MITLIHAGKAYGKTQLPFKTKNTLNKLGTEGKYHNITKVIHEKSTANIILNGETLKAFPLRQK